MKIGLLQMKVLPDQPEENRRTVARLVQEAAEQGCDVAVLPETWNTGFFPRQRMAELAEEDGGASRALLAELAARYQMNLVGGSLVTRREEGRAEEASAICVGGSKATHNQTEENPSCKPLFYNTAYVFDRQGRQLARYDKVHGFSLAGENQFFQPGQALCTFRLDGIPAGLILCYDLRFGELARSLVLQGIQLLFVPAQWPFPRQEHWRILNQARAIENQLYVACVNGCGDYGGVVSCGSSMLVDPLGQVVCQAGTEEQMVCGEADFSQVARVRAQIPVFQDRRPEVYRLECPSGCS